MSLFIAILMCNIWSSLFLLIPAVLLTSLASPPVRISRDPGSVLVVCAIKLCHPEAQATASLSWSRHDEESTSQEPFTSAISVSQLWLS